MHVLFEEDGAFRAGTVLSDAGATLQVELPSGKRTKLKAVQVMLRFAEPGPSEYMQRAQATAEGIDLDFLWEAAPQDEFGFETLAAEYFGAPVSPVDAGGLLMRLHGAPVYFHRKGRGRYRPASAEILRAALAAVERKRQQALQVEEWATALAEGRLPEAIGAKAADLLVRPDRNSIEWKALERACELAKQPAQPLLLAAGAFPSPRVLHVEKFRAEHFPQGFGFPPLEVSSGTFSADDLPDAGVEAFSVDDSTTTEIDDALSVTTLPDGRLRVGVHIAAPGLGIAPGEVVDKVARGRMSTVYMPGDKVTMLPDDVVRRFSLDAGRRMPALSIYVDLDEAGTKVVESFSRADRVHVVENLRHDRLDGQVTEEALADPAAPMVGERFDAALRALWVFAQALTKEREAVRGKPEPRNRADFSFYVDGETVRIVERRRDAPLDRIVAELMILANSRWGRLLADHKVPGIYRSQAPMGRVKMGSHALPHVGLGVHAYMWSTSPLRRYVDLVNQRQLLAVLAGDKPPYAPQAADLFAVIGAFDAKYAAYAEFQQGMERYWCLRWLAQEGLSRVEAVVVRNDLVRLAHAPLYFRMGDLPADLAPGRRILVDVLSTDEIALTLETRFAGLDDAAGIDESALADAAEAVEVEAAEADASEAGADGVGAPDSVVTEAALAEGDVPPPPVDDAREASPETHAVGEPVRTPADAPR